MLFVYKLICLAVGYGFGLFQTGYIYGRLNHVDIREFGSGNAGTTNAMRVLGKKAGIITYFGDMLKGVLAGIFIRILCDNFFDIGNGDMKESLTYIMVLFGGLGVVLGHNYPCYMGFKGGKGIAASSGVIISLFNFPLVIMSMLTFIIITKVSKYVSLGSILMMVFYFIEIIIFGSLGFLKVTGFDYLMEVYILTFVFSGLAVFKHRSNIVRLINKTERKIGEKKENC